MRRPGEVLPAPAPRARLGLRLREPLERRRRLRPLPAREDRPAVRQRLDRDRPRRRVPAPAVAVPRTATRAVARLPVRMATGARVRGGDGGRPRRSSARSSTSRLAHELDGSIDQSLRSRASDLAGVVQAATACSARPAPLACSSRDESFAQVIAPRRSGRRRDRAHGGGAVAVAVGDRACRAVDDLPRAQRDAGSATSPCGSSRRPSTRAAGP